MPTKVADLTIDELQDLLYKTVRDVVEEVIEEHIGTLADPDEGLELRQSMIDSLKQYLKSDRRGDDAEDVFRALGLD